MKNYQKNGEKDAANKNTIDFKVNRSVSVMIKELETDYKLFLQGHVSVINTIAISNDNTHIISGSNDKTIRI